MRSEKEIKEKLKKLKELSKNYLAFLGDKRDYDIVIEILDWVMNEKTQDPWKFTNLGKT